MKVTRNTVDSFLREEIRKYEKRAEWYARKLAAAPLNNSSEHEIRVNHEVWMMYEHYVDCASAILSHYRSAIQGAKSNDKSE